MVERVGFLMTCADLGIANPKANTQSFSDEPKTPLFIFFAQATFEAVSVTDLINRLIVKINYLIQKAFQFANHKCNMHSEYLNM